MPINLDSLSRWRYEQIVAGPLDQPHLFFVIRKG
jgi:hypothetical protein